MLNGVVLGFVAALLYAPPFFSGEPVPLFYVIAEALKIVGGAAAGFVVGGRSSAAAPTAG